MPTDGLDFSTAQMHNSPDVRSWPATATITRMEFRASGVHIEHSKNDRYGSGGWPNFWPGAGWDQGGEGLQYTLWMVVKINGQWQASGGIQFWRSCDENGGPPEGFCTNWWNGATDRWGAMATHQPQPGELVGFLVTAGDARNNGVQSVQERSAVVVLPFPQTGGVFVQAPDTPAPPPDVPPVPDQPPVPTSLTPVTLEATQYDALIARFDAIDKSLAQGRTDLKQAGTDLLKQLPALLLKALTGR